ncbi:hypothetical protein K469DRAFT_323210 [Zopfia rhizophila CBS 207.26]|uniref:Uncharacterized protein n=1 Tax=Zopfia rhizophila CBS 207.26 TaxID=1314779 RepID=A0A6A6DKB1_9PEZI|nr:hypothetical protein K469DRAFT_323210 [Zopfia rhizophila CBS 207.26]
MYHGLVDRNGHRTDSFNASWGITASACYESCGSDKLLQNTVPSDIVGDLVNLLLPWLALTAQLPYASSSAWGNIMSLLLAVGSPALVTYSLALTIFNRRHIWTRFERIYQEDSSSTMQGTLSKEAATPLKLLLEASLQEPLSHCHEREWLYRLGRFPRYRLWWLNVGAALNASQRRVTLPFFVQIIIATVAWWLTIVANFYDWSATIPLEPILIGSIWVWMIPITYGWIAVSTQSRAGSICEAVHSKGEGLSYKYLEPESKTARIGGVNKLTTRYIFDIAGDEQQEGPIYNYAKFFTAWRRVGTITDNFESVKRPLAARGQLNGVGSVLEISCAGPLTTPPPLYTEWKEIPSVLWSHLFIAFLATVFVQWGTTGPAIFAGYMAPQKEPGCFFGGLLIYVTAATVSWLLLVASSLLSHEVMLRRQRAHSKEAPCLPHDRLDRLESYGFIPYGIRICLITALTRILGKSIAVGNAVWLIVWSFLQFSGKFQNCWCRADHQGGWLLLWSGDSPMHLPDDDILKYWIICAVLSSAGCYLASVLIWATMRRRTGPARTMVVAVGLILAFVIFAVVVTVAAFKTVGA